MIERYEIFSAFDFLDHSNLSKLIIGTNFGNIYLCTIELTNEKIEDFIDSSEQFLTLIDNLGCLKKIKKFNNEIRSIELLSKNQIVVASKGGDIAILKFKDGNLENTQYLQRGKHKQDQVWRVAKLNNKQFLSSGTYGTLILWSKCENGWTNKRLTGHSHSIFCLDKIGKNKVITNDYKGINILWNFNSEIEESFVEKTIGNMQHASQIDEKSFAMINRSGIIYQFYLVEDDYIYEANYSLASGKGRDIVLYKNILIAGTSEELIFIDSESLETSFIPKLSCREIKIINNNIFTLINQNLVYIDKEKSERYEEQKIFNYAKIGLIGHTGVGKSSLCYYLKNNTLDVELKSTFGRRIWTLNRNDDFELEDNQQILLYDIAGQESQLFTFYESLSDSDIIFIIFKQTDNETLNRALSHLKELKKFTSPNCKYYLIRNFTDDPHNSVQGIDFSSILERHKIDRMFSISSKKGSNINKLKSAIIEDINWKKTKKMVQSKHFAVVSEVLENLLSEKNIDTMSVKDFQDILKLKIPKKHLRYIFNILTKQGLIEYIKDLDQVIINDKKYNTLKSLIPELIKNKNGIITTRELLKKLSEGKEQIETYIRFQIKLLERNLEAVVFFEGVESKELILVPRHFSDETTELPSNFLSLIPEENEISFKTNEDNFSWYNFLDSIIDLNLNVVQICKKSGVFTTVDNSFCFQILLAEIIEGRKRKQEIKIFYGGKDEIIVNNFLEQIIKKLMHIVPEIKIREDEIKKNKKIIQKKEDGEGEKKNLDVVNPSAFLTYAYSTEEHSDWVIRLATDLREKGAIDCKLDVWNLKPGERIMEYMKQISIVDKVLVVCDHMLIKKLESEKSSGIQIEFLFINNLIERKPKKGDIIPILKEGSKEDTIPKELQGRIYVDFRNAQEYEDKLEELIKAVWDQSNRPQPPLGEIPSYIKKDKD